MRSVRSSAGGAVASAVALLLVASCSSKSTASVATSPTGTQSSTAVTTTSAPATTEASKPAEKVTLTVTGLRPGAEPAAVAAFKAQVADFQSKHPEITIDAKEYEWTASKFAAQVAAGTVPTVFTIPFTDGKSLIERKQISNINDYIKALPYAAGFNPNVLANGQDADGNIYAVPISAYANSLQYNRALFTAAGLDPDKPPTTWEEVRTAAKAIADKTGKAGFTQMAKDATGGWMLTTLTASLGGRMESEDGKTATLDNPQAKQALQMLKDMRWVDNSMGTNASYDWPTSNQDFAAGKIGMYMQGSDVYTFLRTQANIDPKIYGITTIPTAGDNAGILGGGTLAAVKAGATDAEKVAALKWIDYYYLSKLVNEADAVRDAKALVADKQPVGTPSLPVFDKSTWEKSQTWIKDYINVPTAQMAPFNDKIFSQKIVTEPAKSTQAVYQSLDPVVQAVLTDKNANIDELLKTANTAAQRAIDKG